MGSTFLGGVHQLYVKSKMMLYASCWFDSIRHHGDICDVKSNPRIESQIKILQNFATRSILSDITFYLLTNYHYHLDHYWCRLNCPSLKNQSGAERFSSQSSLNVHGDHCNNDIIRINTFLMNNFYIPRLVSHNFEATWTY